MRIEDDIEWDDEDDDAKAIIVIMALTTSCIVMKEHICKTKKAKEENRRSSVYNFQSNNVNTCNLTADVRSIFQTDLSFFTH